MYQVTIKADKTAVLVVVPPEAPTERIGNDLICDDLLSVVQAMRAAGVRRVAVLPLDESHPGAAAAVDELLYEIGFDVQ